MELEATEQWDWSEHTNKTKRNNLKEQWDWSEHTNTTKRNNLKEQWDSELVQPMQQLINQPVNHCHCDRTEPVLFCETTEKR